MTLYSPSQPFPAPELSDEDRIRISEIFHQDIAPKLLMMHARSGAIACEFAGEKYRNWVVQFRSNRAGLDIVGWEYDPDAREISLPHPISSET